MLAFMNAVSTQFVFLVLVVLVIFPAVVMGVRSITRHVRVQDDEARERARSERALVVRRDA